MEVTCKYDGNHIIVLTLTDDEIKELRKVMEVAEGSEIYRDGWENFYKLHTVLNISITEKFSEFTKASW